ncbi:hypothetical protein GPJ56_000147 [Histomonas meleagridis]|uniref:uncharacterized protein n=1 Tax=Histomonas meleagridis TaxID=135588 RepID=UPI00355AACB5|nr:hypothetical protein GPJ56_000147 [Histomonas meleagridis]KAH0805646.1 hypothetical protein GO595_001701 [Histomonas meleagridis]
MSLVVAGYNSSYQLATESNGRDNEDDPCVIEPKVIDIETSNLLFISLGCDHTLFLYSDGTVYGVGAKQFFLEKGEGNSKIPILIPIPNNEPVKWVYAGMKFSAFLTVNGNVYLHTGKLLMKNIVYLSGAASKPYMIDKDGVIHKLKKIHTPDVVLHFQLPMPAYDVCGGKKSALAISTQGKLYGYYTMNPRGRKDFELICELSSYNFKRVFGRAELIGALREDGVGYIANVPKVKKLKVHPSDGQKIESMEFGYCTCFITYEGGDIHCFGNNGSAQLMLGRKSERENIQPLNFSDSIRHIFTGNCHTIVALCELKYLHPGMAYFEVGKSENSAKSVEKLLKFLNE